MPDEKKVTPDASKKRVYSSVQGVIKSPRGRLYTWSNQNPDDIFLKKRNFRIYYEMQNDYQIDAIMTVKKNLICGTGWTIEKPIDYKGEIEDAYPDEIIEFLYENFCENMEGTLSENLKRLLSCMDFGFSLNELVYDIDKKNRIILKELSQMPPDSIEFRTDDFGKLLPDGLIQFTKSGEKALTQKKFIIVTWRKQDGNIYGRSDFRSAYTPWFIKDKVMRFEAMFLERFGFPFRLAKYDPTKIDREETDSLEETLEKMGAASSAAIPNDVEVEFVEAKSDGSAFTKAIQNYDRQLATALILPDLLGLSGEISGGSYGLGKNQFELFLKLIESNQEFLEEKFNEGVIRPLVDLNFGPQETYPKLKLKRVTLDKSENTKAYIDFLKSNVFEPTEGDINQVRQDLGFKKDKVKIREPQVNAPFGGGAIGGNGTGGAGSPQDKKKTVPMARESNALIFAEQFLNVEKIKSGFQDTETTYLGKLTAILKKIRDEVVLEIQAKKPLEKNDVGYVNRFKLPMIGNLRTQFERLLTASSKQGLSDVSEEIKSQAPQEFGIIDSPDIPLSAAKEFLKRLAETQAIKLAGDLADILTREIANVLTDGFRSGRTTGEMVTDLQEVFDPYISGSIIPGGLADPWRLENIVRTNMSTFYNQARIAGMNKAVQAGLVTYYQFSAIMDDRTTEICAELDGTVFPATDTATLANVNPPRHYQCRSLLIPITKYREDDMNSEIEAGTLKTELTEPADFYDGF